MGLKLSSAISSENTIDIFLDFEGDTLPGENEKEIHGQVAGVLFKTEQILEKLKNLKGCEDLIKMSLTKPGTDTEKAVWDAILPEVETLLEFYEFSLELEKIYPKLLISLFQTNGNLKNNLQEKQSLAKQLADIFDFALCFDDIKMVNPFVNHNFSYYRRTLNRMNINNNKDVYIKVNIELANRISMFLSYPTPMMRVLTETTVNFLKNESCLIQDQVIAGFSLMANVCLDMVEKSRFTNSKTIMVCLCGMTGSIILVDHVDDSGAFHKKSTINIKGAITKLKNFAEAECLLNALRFTTVHLSDPETPRTIKRLLQ